MLVKGDQPSVMAFAARIRIVSLSTNTRTGGENCAQHLTPARIIIGPAPASRVPSAPGERSFLKAVRILKTDVEKCAHRVYLDNYLPWGTLSFSSGWGRTSCREEKPGYWPTAFLVLRPARGVWRGCGLPRLPRGDFLLLNKERPQSSGTIIFDFPVGLADPKDDLLPLGSRSQAMDGAPDHNKHRPVFLPMGRNTGQGTLLAVGCPGVW